MQRKPSSRPRLKLSPRELRWHCAPEGLGFETTADIRARPNIIGQDRAMDAIRLGLALRSPGYNIYVSGLTGTGKLTAIRYLLEAMDLARNDLTDICYMHNFHAEDEPVCVVLPAGQANLLKARLKDVLRSIAEYIPAALKSEEFKRKQARIADDIRARREDMLRLLEKDVTEKGFALVQIEYESLTRPEIVPVVGGETVAVDRLPALLAQGKLARGDYERLQSDYPALSRQLDDFLIAARELQRDLDHRTAELEQKHLAPFVDFALREIMHDFQTPRIVTFVEGLRAYVLDRLPIFAVGGAAEGRRREFLPFQVNVLVDNGGLKEAPVVIETSPSFANVFGTIERVVSSDGEHSTDFTAIRSGSLLRANGGYLVVNLIDLFEEPMVWATLKRALKSQRHTIRGFDSLLLMPIASIKPEPVELDIKIILIGDAYSYQALWDHDEDFRTVFKIKAEFDSVMPNTAANRHKYSRFVRVVTEQEKLPAFHKGAVAAVIEEGARLAGHSKRLSTRFSDVGDVVREAAHWARKEKAAVVRAAHVATALKERTRRVNLIEDKMQEMYVDGTILLDTRGAKIGQVNGLAVYDTGDHTFGRPSRITAETGVGRAGVINIERESEMSGRLHNKGMLIMEGYLRRMYAQDKPITVSASLCFEQGYSFVDGDSASCAEMYALLSSLAYVPLRQDIAVTGSMNQKGEVQPIGGVNEKIEGFFDVCRARGLTRKQGVMIPAINVPELMLRDDVVQAVAKGRFHIYAVRTIDEGIQVLSGKKAGKWIPHKGFERGSIHYLVDDGLRHFHERLRDAEDGHGEGPVQKKDKKAPVAEKPKPKPPRKRRPRRGRR